MIEPDGQSIKIEQIRQLQKEFTYSGVESNQKVYIIEGAETLTVNAANRILKFLEEPSQATTAMMLTENGQAMLDRKSTRLNSSHVSISYAVFCLKKKTQMIYE